MADVRPFRVSVPESELKYLRQRLDTARYPDILTNIAPWEDGTDLDYFKVGSFTVSSSVQADAAQ